MLDSSGSLVRFAYRSRATSVASGASLLAMVRSSWKFNHANRVFGVLEYRDGGFSQVIEATRGVMNGLVPDILSDPRHTRIELSAYEVIEARTFGSWSVIGFEEFELGHEVEPKELPTGSNVIYSDRFRSVAPRREGVPRGSRPVISPKSEK